MEMQKRVPPHINIGFSNEEIAAGQAASKAANKATRDLDRMLKPKPKKRAFDKVDKKGWVGLPTSFIFNP